MNFVEPIRDRKRIAQIKNLLRGQGRFRDLLLFVVGVNTALRISDVLRLRVGAYPADCARGGIVLPIMSAGRQEPRPLPIVHAKVPFRGAAQIT